MSAHRRRVADNWMRLGRRRKSSTVDGHAERLSVRLSVCHSSVNQWMSPIAAQLSLRRASPGLVIPSNYCTVRRVEAGGSPVSCLPYLYGCRCSVEHASVRTVPSSGWSRSAVQLSSVAVLRRKGGGRRGHDPWSEGTAPTGPPTEIFGDCNWTSGMKIQ